MGGRVARLHRYMVTVRREGVGGTGLYCLVFARAFTHYVALVIGIYWCLKCGAAYARLFLVLQSPTLIPAEIVLISLLREFSLFEIWCC